MNEIEKMLNEKYFLIKKNRIFYLIGGFMGAAIAILGITYATGLKAVKDAIKEKEVAIAVKDIHKFRVESETSFQEIQRYLSQIKEKRFYHTGQASDGDTIPAPAGTTSDQWELLLIPNEIGLEEKDSMWDNSLIHYRIESKPNFSKKGWVVFAENVTRVSNLKNKVPDTHTDTFYIFPTQLHIS